MNDDTKFGLQCRLRKTPATCPQFSQMKSRIISLDILCTAPNALIWAPRGWAKKWIKMALEATTSISDSPGSRRVWPAAFLMLAFATTLVWAGLLGYGFVRLLENGL